MKIMDQYVSVMLRTEFNRNFKQILNNSSPDMEPDDTLPSPKKPALSTQSW
jgi:hypothetical protein